MGSSGSTCQNGGEGSPITCSDEVVSRLLLGKADATITEQTEQTLVDADGYWSKQLRCMDEKHSRMHKITEKDFEQVVKDAEARYASMTNTKPCHVGAHRQKVQQCYQKYGKHSLMCSQEVRDFTNCIDLSLNDRVTEAYKKLMAGPVNSTDQPKK